MGKGKPTLPGIQGRELQMGLATSTGVNPSLGLGESPTSSYQRLSFWVFSGGWWPRLRDPWPFSLEEVLVEPGALQAGPCPFTTWHF